jgi:hypothetical protein
LAKALEGAQGFGSCLGSYFGGYFEATFGRTFWIVLLEGPSAMSFWKGFLECAWGRILIKTLINAWGREVRGSN